MANFEKILSNPGLQHLAENIFWNLDYEDWEVCRGINQSSKRILDNPNQFQQFHNWKKIHSAAKSPIYLAASNGHTEIVKILAPLTDNPNAPDNDGKTPSSVAKNAEIRGILQSFNTSRKHNAGPSGKPSKKRAKKF